MPIPTQKKPRPWQTADGVGKGNLSPAGYYLGGGSTPLEVALARAVARPTEGEVRSLWKKRKGNTPSPLLLIVTWPGSSGDQASVCGPVGDNPPVYSDRDLGQIERIAANALAEPDHHAATRFLAAYLPEEAGALRNLALFSTHHLVERLPQRSDWADLCQRGETLVGLRGDQLLKALGFTVEPKGHAAVLRAAGNARALAVFLDDNENPDATSGRFNSMTPVSWAIASAASDNIPYVLVTRGPQIRIYTTRSGAGSAGKGGTGAFLEVNLALLTDADSGYLPLLFSSDALQEGGHFESLLLESHDYAAGLGTRLRERVYGYAVPRIAEALIADHKATGGHTDEATLASLYDQALLVLFRLLFVAYAEDRDLLPLRTNGLYRQRSLKHIARDLSSEAERHSSLDDIEFDENATDLWDGVRALWTAIDMGRKDWNVPAYNGGMFSSDPEVDPVGAAVAELEFTNAEFGPALARLLVDETTDGETGPVDFASLDVREFGTIYEGLLESNLAVAPITLTIDRNYAYVPAGPRDEVWVEEGAVYLHNKSGARKASGSYFTKPFAVNHLLDQALEPALEDHIARLTQLFQSGDEVAAAEAFFDFRCADLSMGSGHFLVAAVDRIERRLSEFLVGHHIAGVHDELARLRVAAEKNLAEAGIPSDGADTNALLRRQIARRCIYGVDLNSTAVELARLALWLHTFVRGLPLTSLNHGLVRGNSLTGIGTLDEAVGVLDPNRGAGAVSFVQLAIVDALEGAKLALKRFADTSEATAAEVRQARHAHADAQAAVGTAKVLLDFAVAVRLGEARLPTAAFDTEGLVNIAMQAAGEAATVDALHFPVAFPEVFLRDRGGFDCILGNPPWEKLQLEAHSFYSLAYPGLRGLQQADADREIARIRIARPDLLAEYERETQRTQAIKTALARGPYPGMNAGRPDLYKAFAWRVLQLVRPQGLVGVVLPRKAVEASGMKDWRAFALNRCDFGDVTMLLNSRGWVFDDAEHRYTIGLLSIRNAPDGERRVCVRGPFASMPAYLDGIDQPGVRFSAEDLASWSDSAAFPLLRSSEELAIFSKVRAHPRLSEARPGWAPRGMRELNATDDKEHFEFDVSGAALWPVYKGDSFDLWKPETGSVYAYAEPEHITEVLQARRRNQIRIRRSALYGRSEAWANDPATLPAAHARIAWRDSSRANDSRTMRVALVPPNTILVHQAYTLFWREGGAREEAYALGVMASIPFDWYARQLVESHVTVEFINAAPVPLREPTDALRRRVEVLAGRLAAVDDRYAEWAQAVDVEVGPLSSVDSERLVAELDAVVAVLYGLAEADLARIFETFHVGWDYGPRLAAVLDHFRRLA